MKLVNQEDRIQIVSEEVDVYNIINKMVESGDIQQDEPFYIFDIGDIVRKHQTWIEKMPRVIPHYAVKCNDNDFVLATLAALGTSFDCASKGEINKILDLGVNPDKIIFANPTKPSSHIRMAASNNVKTMTFDCDVELHKIKIFCPDAKLVLRIRCEAETAQCPLGKKFGCDPETEAPRLMKIARSLDLDVVGISFHVGSGCSDYPIYKKAIEYSRNLFDYGEALGYHMNLLDIGGGFPGDNYKTIDDVAVIINEALETYFPDENVRVIAEPGRYYVASAFTLVTNIHSKKYVLNNETNTVQHIMYYINDGVYGSFNCLLYDHQKITAKFLDPTKFGLKTYPSTVFGPTCDALDVLMENENLPDIPIGEYVIFENMGAYTIPVASPFNGFPLPKVHCFVNDDIWQMMKNLISLNEDYFVKSSGIERFFYDSLENAAYA